MDTERFPPCPPGLSEDLQQEWAKWWAASPLAPQMDPPAVARLRRLWFIMAEHERVQDELYNKIGWDNIGRYARDPDGPDWQRVQALIDGEDALFDEYMELLEFFQMTPMARFDAAERDAKLKELFDR